MDDNVILRVENLSKSFRGGRKKAAVKAVDRVSFSIQRGSAFGLIGESGSGKTTTGRLVLRLIEPDSGSVRFRGEEITKTNMRPYRRKMQIIFQNPLGSLDPKLRVYDAVAEGIRANRLVKNPAEERERVLSLLRRMGITEQDAQKYPYEFSGGQQQRIVIARALAVEPELLVCDEPVSALDVSYQAQIINLLEELRAERNMTYLFISHDLSVVQGFCDHIGVMYLGRLVEVGTAEEVSLHAAHPYTKALLQAIPIPDPKQARARNHAAGMVFARPGGEGCSYAPRCPKVQERCLHEVPELTELSNGHAAACFYPEI